MIARQLVRCLFYPAQRRYSFSLDHAAGSCPWPRPGGAPDEPTRRPRRPRRRDPGARHRRDGGAGRDRTDDGIAWRACPIEALPTRECGELTVPLDYDEPDGPAITVAVARAPATDLDRRIGSIITNPGGPGGAGVDALAALYAAMPASLAERF